MIDVELLREHPDTVKKGIQAKNTDPKLVDDFLALDTEWRKLTSELDNLRAEQKKLSADRRFTGINLSEQRKDLATGVVLLHVTCKLERE